MQRRAPRAPLRGYTLMVVVVLGLVLASLSTILLFASERDRSEGRSQRRTVSALYAAESGVAVGVESVRAALEESLTPDLVTLAATAKATATAAIPGASYDTFSIKYYDPATNTTSTTAPSNTAFNTITSGQNVGLKAQQSNIQVFAVANFENATASLADAVRIDLIPIFQFAMFFDGDLDTDVPAPMTVGGRVHTNGNLYLSNGALVDFRSPVTVAGRVHSHSASDTTVKVGSGNSATRFFSPTASPAGQVAIANNLPRADGAQKTYLQQTYGADTQSNLGDQTTGVTPVTVPLRLSSSTTCTTTCSGDRACVKVKPTDSNGVCMDRVVSRPPVCSDGTAAKFAQSMAVEVVRRPAAAYAGDGAEGNPYDDDIDNDQSDIYTAHFGPRPAITGASRTLDDLFEVQVSRSVPVLGVTTADDEPGALNDRMWWKADIRIIDGVWYKKGSNVAVFNPETVDYRTSNPSPNDVNHKFARVLRYSWWWDAREGRVYCEGATGTGNQRNCVTNGNEYQRGQQIRSADFDVAEFMSLLEDASARALLFPGGTVPADGVIVYMSETYDAKYEDANTKLPRAANVRNFLSFPYLHNHLNADQINSPTDAAKNLAVLLPARVAPAPRYTDSAPSPPTPYQLGWYPENIWGRLAPAANDRSLSVPLDGSSNNVITVPAVATAAAPDPGKLTTSYRAPNRAAAGAVDCQDASSLTSARQPASRPASMSTPGIKAPCIQAGATPLGAENAVRLVRAQTVPSNGFTFVTDNRLYLHGDVNVRANNSAVVAGTTVTTNQDIAGKVALLADSITILSDRFDDRDRQANGYLSFFKAPDDSSLRTFTTATGFVPPWSSSNSGGDAPNLCSLGATAAVHTRVNASLLMGDVPACILKGFENGNRSGGVNNFPRFAEDWSSIDNVINGSMVGLFRAERGNARFLDPGFGSSLSSSRSATAYPTPTCVYVPPNRRWTFDDALGASVSNLPPGTPRVVAGDRLRWVRR